VVDHWHVSTPARAGHHPSSWYRFEGSGLPVHHIRAIAVREFLRAIAGTAKRVLAMAILSVCLSVRPSVCPGVTTRYRIKPRRDRDTAFSPYDSLESLVSYEQIWCRWVHSPRTMAPNRNTVYHLRNRYFTAISSSSV